MKTKFTIFLFVAALLLPSLSVAVPISSTDLWDVSQGTLVDSTSGALNYRPTYASDVRNMLGGTFGTIEAGNLLFKDFMSPGYQGGSVPAGFTHYVEWHTSASVTLRSFALHASNEGMTRRSFSEFSLYSGDGSGTWSSFYDSDTVNYNAYQEFSADITPVTAQYFRAEFVQASWSSNIAVGPRILELDGFDTFLDGSTGGGTPVPEPATILLFGLGLFSLAGVNRKKQ